MGQRVGERQKLSLLHPVVRRVTRASSRVRHQDNKNETVCLRSAVSTIGSHGAELALQWVECPPSGSRARIQNRSI